MKAVFWLGITFLTQISPFTVMLLITIQVSVFDVMTDMEGSPT